MKCSKNQILISTILFLTIIFIIAVIDSHIQSQFMAKTSAQSSGHHSVEECIALDAVCISESERATTKIFILTMLPMVVLSASLARKHFAVFRKGEIKIARVYVALVVLLGCMALALLVGYLKLVDYQITRCQDIENAFVLHKH